MKIIRRLIEKALEISIKKVTEKNKMHGIFLLDEPIPLYRCERARLYNGFLREYRYRKMKQQSNGHRNPT
ncbi:MAG: hypothetical protein WAM42_01675, partial [Candidatus Nitrosopolaris sp.]